MSKKVEYLPFDEAREFVRNLGLKGESNWRDYSKNGNKPNNIPAGPSRVYINEGWVDWADFLGTKNISNIKINNSHLVFEEAREFSRKLNLKGQADWFKYIKNGQKPTNIPSNPQRVYKNNGWVNWGDWVGTGNISCKFRKYMLFEDARKLVRGLKLKNQREWRIFSKSNDKPIDIPSNPEIVYKDKGWVSVGDWLGTGNIHTKDSLSFEDAREFSRKLNLKGQTDWFKYCKSENKPENIPSNPQRVYKNSGWVSFGDWLGTFNVAPRYFEYMPFEEAREFIRNLNLKSRREWIEYCKSGLKPNNIPSHPERFYKKH